MPDALVIAPHIAPAAPSARLACSLRAAGWAVVCCAATGGVDDVDALMDAFGGRPPDALVADLSATSGSLPLVYARRLLRNVWGDDLPPPVCLALLTPAHLTQPEWAACADDFLLPPYDDKELHARLKLLRFRRRHVPADDLLRFADVVLDLNGKRALNAQMQILPLTPREYDLLAFLVTHRGKFFGRDQLLSLVWGIQFEGGERTVDIHIRRLRAKLPPLCADRLQTRRGTGYGVEV